jgi:hypothetical protein
MKVKQNIFLISLAYLFYANFLLGYLWVTSLGLAFSLFISLLFLFKMGKEFAIKELILLIASGQWIVGAKIGYNIGKVHYKYYMYVEEEVYMNFVVPGVILFYIGLNLIKTNLSLNNIYDYINKNRKNVLQHAKIISVTWVISVSLGLTLGIAQLSFIFYLSNSLLYVAIAYYMCLFPQYKFKIFLFAILLMLVFSLKSGFFHDMIILASFLSFFLFYENTSFFKKMILISVGFIGLYTIQLIKFEYRSIIWETKGDVSVFSAFYTVLEQEFFSKPVYNNISAKTNEEEEDDEQSNVNTRLNQGWIISKVMENVPKNQPFLQGETIIEAIESGVLPRFLFPNKKGAEQALINFGKISGIDLRKGTSMGLSIIAEFYANYGILGGWIAMFVYGLFLTFVMKYLIHGMARSSPLIILWFILFFFQVVKAETDFIKIFNHLVKSILFFISIRFIYKSFNVELFPDTKNK